MAQSVAAFVNGRLTAWATPGLSLVVVHQNEVLHNQGYGVADITTGIPMTADTLSILGSTTKAMTGLAVMQLVEAGQLELDAPVTRYLPDFAMRDPRGTDITLRHLMSHSSGFPWGTLFTGRDQPEVLGDYVASLQGVRLERDPGSAYGYSNDTFTILGLIIQEVTGVPYERYMHENVFGPLEMTATTFDLEAARERGLAAGHRNEYGQAAPHHVLFTDSENPAGKLITSTRDLENYFRMLLAGGVFEGQRIISEASLETMWTPVVDAGNDGFYAHAWYRRDIAGLRFLAHPGSVGSHGSRFILVPEAELAVGVLSNSSQPADPRTEIAESVVISTLLFGDTPFERPALPTAEADAEADIDPSRLAEVAGVYSSAAGEVRLEASGDTLTGTVAGQKVRLEPLSATRFVLRSDFAGLEGVVLEYRPADTSRAEWLRGNDRLVLMEHLFAFRQE